MNHPPRLYQLGALISLCLGLTTILPKLAREEETSTADLVSSSVFAFLLFFSCWIMAVFFTKPAWSRRLGPAWLRFTLFLCCCILLTFVLHELYELVYKSPLPLARMRTGKKFFMLCIRAVAFGSLQFLVVYYLHISSENQRAKIEIGQLKHENLQARLALLQQQVSPHFLFNSLSTLKNMVSEKNAKTYVVELSRVYRYLLAHNDHPLVTASSEIDFSRSYLYILHERFENALKVDISVDESQLDKKIPAMSLQLLIENAVKHNTATPAMPLEIRLYTQNNCLVVSNRLQTRTTAEEPSGTGLQNIIDRYRLLGAGDISIEKTSQAFTVRLPLIT